MLVLFAHIWHADMVGYHNKKRLIGGGSADDKYAQSQRENDELSKHLHMLQVQNFKAIS